MAHPATAPLAPDQRGEAVGDGPTFRRVSEESRSFAPGAYDPSTIQADWADFELMRSLPEDPENG